MALGWAKRPTAYFATWDLLSNCYDKRYVSNSMNIVTTEQNRTYLVYSKLYSFRDLTVPPSAYK